MTGPVRRGGRDGRDEPVEWDAAEAERRLRALLEHGVPRLPSPAPRSVARVRRRCGCGAGGAPPGGRGHGGRGGGRRSGLAARRGRRRVRRGRGRGARARRDRAVGHGAVVHGAFGRRDFGRRDFGHRTAERRGPLAHRRRPGTAPPDGRSPLPESGGESFRFTGLYGLTVELPTGWTAFAGTTTVRTKGGPDGPGALPRQQPLPALDGSCHSVTSYCAPPSSLPPARAWSPCARSATPS
ncbi:hypothetical protein NKH77_32305 [Streptomyces sp. M19]